MTKNGTVITSRRFNFWYGSNQALRSIDLQIPSRKVTAIIGPSGCGKSTFLKSINRMIDLIETARFEGELFFNDQEVQHYDVVDLRTRIGMVFQKPNPFPKSIYQNIAFGLRLQGTKTKVEQHQIVEDSLRKAALWDEVKDRLHDSALGLSGGQQQRLCIARSLAVQPEVILMDEPCSALDPISTAKIEDLIHQLQTEYSIVIVTHNMQQAARVSDYMAFFLQGELIEFGETPRVFELPMDKRTEDYLTGRFG